MKYARVVEMPDGVLLKSGTFQVSEQELKARMANYPAEIRKQLEKNAFFLLEQVVVETLLVQAARKQFGDNGVAGKDNRELVNLYFQQSLKGLTATETEARQFFEENKTMMGGATFDQVKTDLLGFLTQEKRKKAGEQLIGNLGRILSPEVNRAWTEKQAVLARDNPVDKARASGLPTLVDFGADGCVPCDMMAPILKSISEEYKGKLNVVFVHVRKEQVLSARYGIQSIPVQIFFDKNGQEVFRHTGFMSREEIEKRLNQLGMK
ncbi:MAG TPA: thioredoxin domain-containing protein [bacterium]|nr:thioredoxin domain-containing protein [bacterium]